MARSSNGGDSKPSRTPTRRRSDKAAAPSTSPASANERSALKDIAGMSLKDADYTPSPAEIQRRAFELYMKRGCDHGRDLEDWYEAERQLRRQEGKERPRG